VDEGTFGVDVGSADPEPEIQVGLIWGGGPSPTSSTATPTRGAIGAISVIALQLRANSAYDIRVDGARLDCLPVCPGMVNIYDLRGSVVSASGDPFPSLTISAL
jgi:hypothetical protein